MNEKKSKSSTRIPKFSTLTDLEYISVIKNKKSVLEIDGVECDKLNNKTWREFQHYLGSKLTDGYYYYNLKQTTSPEIHSGTIRAVNKNPKPQGSNMEAKDLESRIITLNDKIEKILNSKENLGSSALLEAQKAGYEAQITYLKQQLSDKDIKIKDLNDEIKLLEKEIDKLELQLNEADKTASWVSLFKSYEPMIKAGLSKLGAKQTSPTLASAPTGEHGIPDEIINILSQVDYDELKKSPENYNKIIEYLSMAVSSLPKRSN